MSIDVVHLLWTEATIFQRVLHGLHCPFPFGGRSSNVIRISTHPVTGHLAVYRRPAIQGIL